MRTIGGFFVAAAAAFAVVLPARSEVVDGIQGIVHDAVITSQEVRQMTLPAARVLEREYRGQDEVLRKKLSEAARENLDQLVERQLILHEFKASGFNLPESTLDDLVEEELRTQYKDRRTMAKTLQERGTTFERFRTKLREQYIVSAMRHKYISQEIIVSPQKMEKYYAAHRNEFKVEDKVKLRMIELGTTSDTNAPSSRKMASEILRQIKDGASFSEMAALYTQRTRQKTAGEWFEKTTLRPEFQGVLKLKAGEHTDVIETPDACYLLEVEEILPEHYRPLPEVRDVIEKNLVDEERNRLEKQWVERLKKKTFVLYIPGPG